MQLSVFAIIATLATFAATSPIAESSPAGVALRRAISKAYFSEAELADTDVESCCCCVPPSEIINVDHLHRMIAVSE
ncbi:MAG: hypothetical protein Q9161_000806 [Pseudevernia consocians]